ncbi:polysaccharide deacetylase family protein [Rouxiella sp. Mn2063]|uniref:polysaccharide deacetylase family protein n=1 Tax=Rouxiella sp. Mn2063 TaxID=3395262 RepID=UPI003BE6010B
MTASNWMSALGHHQRYDYHGPQDLPDYRWPGGKRLAVYVAMNLEHFSFGCSEGAKLAPVANKLDVLNYSWRDYGNRVGGWHLADLFQRLGLPASVICNTSILDYCPQLLDHWMSGDGSELIAHGHTNSERQGELDVQAENEMIAMCQQRLSAYAGKPIDGWLSPWISESTETPDLLKQNGFSYNLNWAHDDRPMSFATRHGDLLSVPYPQEINDIPTIIPNGASAELFSQMILDQLAELLERSEEQTLVMGIALHPYIVGQPFRFHHLKKALATLAEQQDRFWLTTPGAIARHHQQQTGMTAQC